MTPPQKPTHGGKRKGSGRKPTGTIHVHLYLKPETVAKIKAVSGGPRGMSKVVDERFK